jgi:hypothetical protein
VSVDGWSSDYEISRNFERKLHALQVGIVDQLCDLALYLSSILHKLVPVSTSQGLKQFESAKLNRSLGLAKQFIKGR